ncbi:MAG: DNA repair protein RadC [Deltaproteobacteria bacterium]|nr:MAG: DNA repair protein RadC [Deltaproteobacteria bacterium]
MPPTLEPVSFDPRPRERLAAEGAAPLSDRDLLALVLGPGGGPPARALLEAFDDLHGIARAGLRDLERVRGVGRARASALCAAFELGRRHTERMRARGPRLRSAQDVHDRLAPRLRHHAKEVFLVLLLDTRHRVLAQRKIAEGGLTACAIHPREVFEPAIREGAASILFVHNHPSGDPTPSAEDLALTRRLVLVGEALGIPALDHVILGDGTFVSLAEAGLLGRDR